MATRDRTLLVPLVNLPGEETDRPAAPFPGHPTPKRAAVGAATGVAHKGKRVVRGAGQPVTP